MLHKTFSILSVLFILMLAATLTFANDQLNGGVAGINSTAATFTGYIVRLQWYSFGVTQLRMVVRSQPVTLQRFIVNSDTKIDINGQLAGPRELSVGDVVTVVYGQNNLASKVSVRRPTPTNVIKMNCKIEEIRLSGASYVFVMESMTSSAHYYELIVTKDSKLVRNGRLADPSEFQVGDTGTARFYLENLKILSFVTISPN